MQQEVIEAISTSSFVVHCGLLSLDVQLGASYSQVNDSVSVAVPEAIHAFQKTFPDRYGFRVRLISEALMYEASDPDHVNLLPHPILV